MDTIRAAEPCTHFDAQSWDQFQVKHGVWLERAFDVDGFLFALPPLAVRVLSNKETLEIPPISPTDADAERHFSARCADFHAIGYSRGQFLRYPPLGPRPENHGFESISAKFPELGWTAEQTQEVIGLLARTDDIANRLEPSRAG